MQNEKCFLRTFSGRDIDMLSPQVDDINIDDIICGLSKNCRFNGQIIDFYSVAQHSVLMSRMVPEYLKRAALMHDASEAYLGDLITQVKALLGEKYKQIEERFMRAIFARFDIPWHHLRLIKDYDREILRLEKDRWRNGSITAWLNFCCKMRLSPDAWMPNTAENIMRHHFEFAFNLEKGSTRPLTRKEREEAE